MPREPGWDIDKPDGDIGEARVWHLRALHLGDKIEVKYDRKAVETGNFYIETECKYNGIYMPSGIQTTKSLGWSLVVPQTGVVLSMGLNHIKNCIAHAPSAECRRGTHPTRGYLVTLTKLVFGHDS